MKSARESEGECLRIRYVSLGASCVGLCRCVCVRIGRATRERKSGKICRKFNNFLLAVDTIALFLLLVPVVLTSMRCRWNGSLLEQVTSLLWRSHPKPACKGWMEQRKQSGGSDLCCHGKRRGNTRRYLWGKTMTSMLIAIGILRGMSRHPFGTLTTGGSDLIFSLLYSMLSSSALVVCRIIVPQFEALYELRFHVLFVGWFRIVETYELARLLKMQMSDRVLNWI